MLAREGQSASSARNVREKQWVYSTVCVYYGSDSVRVYTSACCSVYVCRRVYVCVVAEVRVYACVVLWSVGLYMYVKVCFGSACRACSVGHRAECRIAGRPPVARSRIVARPRLLKARKAHFESESEHFPTSTHAPALRSPRRAGLGLALWGRA